MSSNSTDGLNMSQLEQLLEETADEARRSVDMLVAETITEFKSLSESIFKPDFP